MKRIALLGSTGSIGMTTLDVVARYPREFSVVGLTAFDNAGLLSQQIKRFHPRSVAIRAEKIRDIRQAAGSRAAIFDMPEGMEAVAVRPDVDIVVVAVSGAAALKPLLAAIRCGKTIALANKEALVMAGSIVMREARRYGATIIPIDSEQSAIFQCLRGNRKDELKALYLTASGGALYDYSCRQLQSVSAKQVLAHPRWDMGRKITVDSATLMNKGLELIEARWLFDVDVNDIKILIHREAIIHSMVEFVDGVILAQLGITHMRVPIQFALGYPKRLASRDNSLDFSMVKKLSFELPDMKKFPCLSLAYEAASRGGTAACVLNAANEVAVHAFLEKKIRYLDIYTVIVKVLRRHRVISEPALGDLFSTDEWARVKAREVILN